MSAPDRPTATATGSVVIPRITIEALLAQYEVLLFDAYGVLVHTSGRLPGAAELLARLNAAGRAWFVVTNDASKLPETAAARYRRFGLPIGAEHVISSGSLIAPYFAAEGLADARCAVLGPVDSVRYVEQAGGEVVEPGEPFDVLVIGDESGFPFLESADAALSTLFALVDAGRTPRLILPNPDLIYPGAGGFGFAAGSVAAMFEGALQLRYPDRTDLRFVHLGKPNVPIFAEAVRRGGSRSTVMLGDQLQTDIIGARAAGLDVVWVGTGVTTSIPVTLAAHLRPTWSMPSLVAE